MKKTVKMLCVIGLAMALIGCGKSDAPTDTIETQTGTRTQAEIQGSSELSTEDTGSDNETKSEVTATEEMTGEAIAEAEAQEETEMSTSNQMTVQVGSNSFTVTLADNESAKALKELLKEGPRTISCSNYGGFEKVCSLGTSLPRKDAQTTTSAGDVMLYSGNQIVFFYDSNSWSYTRIGKVDDEYIAQLEDILSGNEAEITLSLAE